MYIHRGAPSFALDWLPVLGNFNVGTNVMHAIASGGCTGAIAHGGCTGTARESALETDIGRELS